MNKLFCIFLFFLSFQLNAQSGFNKSSHDFKEIYKNNKRFVDITYTNTTSKKVYLLSIKNERRIKVLTSGKTILPDSTVIIRIKFNPTGKGKFKIKTPIYVSNAMEPFNFIIKGNVKEIDNAVGLSCPSFGEKNITQEQNFKLKVLVLDAQTHEPIKDAIVNLIANGVVMEKLKTNSRGKSKATVPLGLYYIVTTAKGYFTSEFSKYLNKQNNTVTIYLDRNREKPKEVLVVKIDTVIDVVTETDTSLIVGTKEIIKPVIDTVVEEENLTEFSKKKYKPNNIVFLLDVSSSMRAQGKLDLLKASMIEMTSILRDVDKITIIAYSTFSKVLMETTSGDKKEEIIETIKKLKAQGMTAGAEGMKQAYKEAYKNYIKGGNNQVIMATDGDFNRGTTKIDKLVKKYLKKGVKISVLGIKNKEKHAQDMKEISALGNGHYLFVDNYDTSKKILIEEIKNNSLR